MKVISLWDGNGGQFPRRVPTPNLISATASAVALGEQPVFMGVSFRCQVPEASILPAARGSGVTAADAADLRCYDGASSTSNPVKAPARTLADGVHTARAAQRGSASGKALQLAIVKRTYHRG